MINRSEYFKVNLAEQLKDIGSFDRKTYSLDPIMECMRTIGFNTAYNKVDDDFLLETMNDEAPCEMMMEEGG